MKSRTCFFTGHRNLPPDDIYKIRRSLKQTVISLIENGTVYFGCGGARGFDLLAAQVILELRKTYPDLRLIMVYPCRNQTRYWNDTDKEIYEYIRKRSDKCVWIANEYNDECMQRRNRHLVNNSKLCICYLTDKHSGTQYTVNYAEKKGVTIINIADNIT